MKKRLTIIAAGALFLAILLFPGLGGLGSLDANGIGRDANGQTNGVMENLSQPYNPAYPRLGMWWLDPYTADPADIARYDLLLQEFEGDELQEVLRQVRAINPDIQVFRPLSPSEMDLFWEVDGDQIPNPEIKNLPSAFFMLQAGSTLTRPVNPRDTRIFVQDLYYENGAPRFEEGGQVAIGDYESALVVEIDDESNCLVVERGYVRPASAHSAGESIASHVRFWPGSWVMNVTAACPRLKVKEMRTAVNYVEYYYNLCRGDYNGIYGSRDENIHYIDVSNGYSGIIIDRFEDKESWLAWNEDDEEVELDLRHNNTGASPEDFDASWQAGTDQLYSLLRQGYPGLKIIRNNPLSNDCLDYDGQVYESGGWENPSASWWKGLFLQRNSSDYYAGVAYMQWFTPRSAEPVVMMEVYEDESSPAADSEEEYENPYEDPNFSPDYRRMRFALCSTLMGNGYFSYEINTEGHGSLGLMWFDEYDNSGQGQGYLGYPAGNCRRLSSGAYIREFDNGFALVNPGAKAVTVSLGQNCTRIDGDQAPDINDGATVNRVTVPAWDGLILLK